ncbi:ABC transporter substrate-binding protein [Catellatospora citrea]|uniref:ABC transporter substrate-binding protein n=1 Tax=Catellatospora citrea TaxID=53366 RepID=UPI0033D50956
MNRRFRHRLAAVTAVAALVLPATACGADEPAPGAPATVVLGFSAWPGWFPWQVAQEQGLFAKNGVTVELKYFDSYTDSLTALATGNLSANSQTLGDTLTSVSGGAQQTIVLVNDNSTGNDQIIAKPGINTIADLKGKRVAVEQGTVDHYLLLLALKTAGLTEADIALKPMLTDAGAAAFTTGEVDAVGAFAPFTTTALGLAGSKAIATSADFPGAIPDHLVFTAAFVKDHPTEVQAVVKTWFDTLAWIKANPDAAIDIMAKKAGVSAADYKSYDAGTTIFNREQNLAAFTPGSTPANLDFQAKSIAEFMVSAKLVDSAPPLDGLLEPKFVQAVSP